MTNDDRSLLLDFISDDLTAEEWAAVVARLKADPEFAASLIEVATDEARLMEWARTSAGASPEDSALWFPTASQAELGAARPAASTGPAGPTRSTRARRYQMAGLLIAAAASVALVAAWRTWIPQPQEIADRDKPASYSAATDLASRPSVARVINESGDSVWYTESHAHRDLTNLCAGDTLRLNRGTLRILYAHGTSLTLQAPSVLEVQGVMQARIHRGSIRVLVARGAEGFSVSTPLAKVVDLGTEFGVRVDECGETEVAVFQGAVDVEGRTTDQGPSALTQRLSTGQAVRVDQSGTASRLVSIERRQFPQAGTFQPVSLMTTPVITEVLDNIDRAGSFQFYEIVQGGMSEDAPAFVDRPEHQWNGIDEKGMPAYLIGGDYVRTFNDDKLSDTLEITVRLQRLADIYVLLDDRAQPPPWLAAEYELMPEKIGVDEGSGRLQELGPDGEPVWRHHPVGVGPGASVDKSFSIWKKKTVAHENVVFGPLFGQDWDTNMYGVVAVPLEEEGASPSGEPRPGASGSTL